MPATKKIVPKKYPPETVQRAKELFDTGMSGAKIAKELEIPRRMTIYEWIKKYGWERPLDKPLNSNDDQGKIFTLLADKALKYLQSKGFSSMSEAMRVYKDAMICLELTKKKKTETKKGVLGILEETGGGKTENESKETEIEKSEEVDEQTEEQDEQTENELNIDIEALVSDQRYHTEEN